MSERCAGRDHRGNRCVMDVGHEGGCLIGTNREDWHERMWARLSASEARAKELETERDEARFMLENARTNHRIAATERDEARRALRTLADSVTAYGEKIAGPEPRGPFPIWPVSIRDALIAAIRALSVGVSRTEGER
jgi:hypothetical protein